MLPCDFSFANSCRQIHIFCAKFIISLHLATMAIGSVNPGKMFVEEFQNGCLVLGNLSKNIFDMQMR